jgi:hypothetical protein
VLDERPLTTIRATARRGPRGIRARAAAAVAALSPVLTAACSSVVYPVSTQTFSAAPSHPRDPANVEVLTDIPDKPFVQVARLSTESVNYDSPGHAVERLKRAAAEHGADAIIIEARGTNPVGPNQSFSTTSADFGFGPAVQGQPGAYEYMPSQFARVLAIRWIDLEAPASAPASRPVAASGVK